MKGNCENSPIEIVSIRCVPIRQLCCGGSHSGVLSYTGTIYMWGKNEFGQLGLNDTQNRLIPTIQSTLRTQRISFIDCGEEHSAALTSDGGLFTWGAGMYGQLGHAKNVNEILPRRVFELMGNTVTQVSCGRCHTLASVGSNGKVYAFGLNGSGQLGIGTQISKFVPINVRGKWIDLGVKDLAVRDIAGSLMPFPKESLPNDPKQNTSRKAKSPVNGSSLNESGDEMQSPSYEMSIDEMMENEEIDSEEMSADESAIIEEPDDKSKSMLFDVEPSFVCTTNTIIPTRQESVEIDEYLSDPDSDKIESEQLVLTEVVASKGDQSFVLVSRLTDKSKPKDFRFDNPFDEIYKLENSIFDELKTSKEKTISYDTIDYVENVFSSISCWNASYINFSDNSDSALPSIDWNSALRGFHYIEEVESGRFHEAILHSILKIIPKLPNIYDQKSLDPEVLRIYLLLPLFHMFRTGVKSNDIMKNLIAGYSRAVTRLSDYALEALDYWWSRINKQYFRKLIKIYKKSVEELLSIQDKENLRNSDQSNQNQKQNLQIDLQLHENLSLCLNLLSLLHKVNQKSGKISYKEFYIEGISDKFDVKQDYIHWLISKTQQLNRNPSQKTLYLCDYPFIFDPPAKTLILSTDSFIQQQNAAENSVYRMSIPFIMPPILVANPFLVLSVTRDTILQSTIEQLCNSNKNPSELKKPLKVNFEGEEAIDAGAGMKKEFFLLLMKEMLDQKFGMFIEYNETHSIWFNPGDVGEHEDLVMYNLIGIVCGLAIYNQVIIYLPFPLALYKKLLNEPLNIDDLNCLDPILAKNLKDILNSKCSAEEFNAIYGDLNFTINLQCYGSAVEFELEKGGKDKALNWENRCDYVRLYWNFILNESVKNQFDSFKSGFNKVLDAGILQLFHAEELMRLLTGEEVSDWVLLEKVTEYKDPFNANHPTIILFWKVFHSLSEEEKKKFLLFLTGSDRIPILGMKALKVLYLNSLLSLFIS
jgi:E3 ubiquitin-protein ligase HERC4